ncbi:MAG: hypothetical protein KA792_02565 [Bacteroidales bacterium]|nr:hypothetical protein [Bacteroidales bacterium]
MFKDFFNSPWFLIVPYLVFSIFLAYLARNKEIGSTKIFLISITLTPLIGLVFLIVSPFINPYQELDKKLNEYECKKCGWKFSYKFENCPNCNAPYKEPLTKSNSG